jgi:hypothetical protein
MDGTRQLTTWALAITTVALLAAGCSSAQFEEDPATGVAPSTTTAPLPAPTQQESPGPEITEPPSAAVTTPPTTATTTTTEAPGSADSDADVAARVIIEDLDTDKLDALLADLDRIFGDLDESFTQDEGDIFDE